ncbi:MAG: hypothetical protein PHY43_05405 [Verrucomicrobiales bacterium]|nr:hypothetical protein [Verrucomicrobiales bacterium]
MKTSISRFFLLGAALATLALASACSQQSSNAQAQTSAPPAVSATSVPTVQTAPAMPAAPEIPPVTATPATIPPNIVPTSPLAQVVRLAQAGVDESIIMVYVTNSSRTFNLDSDKIIYLTDLGVPTDVVTAMMQRDQFLQQQFAAAQAEQLAQQTQQTQQEQTAPAPEAAPADTEEVASQPAPVTVNYFNETLSPYGSWVVVNGYGRCWRPAVCVYNPGWQPYCDRGHWVYTDCGWYWSSDYAWGATFHYGRWFNDASIGWCWYPDTVWAPSWVTWRYSNNYCGWAPLPPRTYCQTGVGLVYQNGNFGLGLNFGLGASCYTFVPSQYFCNPHPRNYCASPGQVAQIYNNTKIVNNIKIKGNGNNQIIINNGIPVQNVAATTQTPIRQVPVHEIDRSFVHGGHGQPMDRPSRVFGGNRANFTGNAGSPAQPSVPARTETPSSTTVHQYPPHSIVVNGSGNNRPARAEAPAQNRFPQPTVNQTPQVEHGQMTHAPVRTRPERNNLVATAPQRPASSANYHAPAYTAPVQTPPANFNSAPQPAPARWQQPVTPRNYTRNPEARQNMAAQNRVVAPPVNYSAPPQAQPQPRSYSQPRNEVRQNYSQPAVVAPPQPQRSAPSIASASAQQQQGGGRWGNQNWGPR